MESESNNTKLTFAEMAINAREDRPEPFDVSQAVLRHLRMKEKRAASFTVTGVSEMAPDERPSPDASRTPPSRRSQNPKSPIDAPRKTGPSPKTSGGV